MPHITLGTYRCLFKILQILFSEKGDGNEKRREQNTELRGTSQRARQQHHHEWYGPSAGECDAQILHLYPRLKIQWMFIHPDAHIEAVELLSACLHVPLRSIESITIDPSLRTHYDTANGAYTLSEIVNDPLPAAKCGRVVFISISRLPLSWLFSFRTGLFVSKTFLTNFSFCVLESKSFCTSKARLASSTKSSTFKSSSCNLASPLPYFAVGASALCCTAITSLARPPKRHTYPLRVTGTTRPTAWETRRADESSPSAIFSVSEAWPITTFHRKVSPNRHHQHPPPGWPHYD